MAASPSCGLAQQAERTKGKVTDLILSESAKKHQSVLGRHYTRSYRRCEDKGAC